MIESIPPLKLGYILVFGGASILCFASVRRLTHIIDDDTRRGLLWLLVLSGGWAAAEVAVLVLPTTDLKIGAHIVGLIVGLATVGPWLYFCSAYTGRSFHRNATFQRVAVGVFLAIALVKLTNPLHQLYFSTTLASTPFVHLAVENGIIHWLAMGAAYALAAIGYFMLFELFWRVGQDTTSLMILVSLTAVPLGLDILGLVTPYLLDISYEPLGVAIFAVGTTSIYLDEFQSVQVAASGDDPILILDDDDRVREYNREALSLFPPLEPGLSISVVHPELASSEVSEQVLEIVRDGESRYYAVSSNPFSPDHARLGRVLNLTDVTERRRNREELERQNERLQNFASVVSHDLRNPLNVARGRLELAREDVDNDHLQSVADAHDRMEVLIDDILALARQGQPIDGLDSVSLRAIASRSWDLVETGDATLSLGADLTFLADVERVRQLLENLFRNAVEHGGPAVTVSVGALEDGSGFYVADDGMGIPEADREQVLESGYSTSPEGTGFGLGIVSEIVDAHGWKIIVTESEDGGARFEIRDVQSTNR